MPIIWRCPACIKRLSAPDRYAGRIIDCPKCKASVAVPAAEPSQSALTDLPPIVSLPPDVPSAPPPAVNIFGAYKNSTSNVSPEPPASSPKSYHREGLIIDKTPPLPDPLPDRLPFYEKTETQSRQWDKEDYALAVVEKIGNAAAPFVSFDMFDIHFTRFITVPWITIIWVMLIIGHFLSLAGGMIYLGYSATIPYREFSKVKKRYKEDLKEYETKLEDYNKVRDEFQRKHKAWKDEWVNFRNVHEKWTEDRKGKEFNHQWRAQNPEPQPPNTPEPREPNIWPPQKPEEPVFRYTGPSLWQFPVFLVGGVVAVAVQLFFIRLFLEFIIVIYRNEANTRVPKEHYLKMMKEKNVGLEELL